VVSAVAVYHIIDEDFYEFVKRKIGCLFPFHKSQVMKALRFWQIKLNNDYTNAENYKTSKIS